MHRYRRPDRRWILTLLLPLAPIAAACSDPTAACRDDPRSHCTGPGDLTQLRAQWHTHNLTDYQYDYRLTGFFISYAGHPIRITVRHGAVQSAIYVETGKPLPEPLNAWPTVDALFDEVARAAQAGDLIGVRYDPRLGFPTEIDLAGPPDASGSVFASNLQPLP